MAGYYSDLCTIYEKAEKYAEAKRNCEVYLASLADPAQISEVRQRIAGIEFGIEKATATKAAADTPQAREAALLQKVEGAKFVYHTNNPQVRTDDIYEIRNRTLVLTYRIYSYTSQNLKYGKGPAPGDYLISRAPYRDGAFNLPFDGGFTQVYRIRPDGQALIAVEGFYNSNPNDRSFGNRSLVIPRE